MAPAGDRDEDRTPRQSSGEQNGPHPVDRLHREHDVIRAVLDAVDAEARRIEGGGPFRRAFWIRTADFIERFVDGFHHKKEEDVLFPLLVECGLSERRGPIAVLRHEHDSERWLQERLLRAVRSGDREDVAQSARAFTYRMRVHVDKEDRVVLEIARVALEPEQVDRLRARLDEAESASSCRGADFLDEARRLCRTAEVPFAP